MLYSIDSQHYIYDVPHQPDYDVWRGRLSGNEYVAIMRELESRIQGDEILTSSWIPGADWTGSVFQPIYEKACRRDFDASARFFGLLVWEAVLNDEDVWAFGRYEKEGVPIEGMTYFKLSSAPAE